jgi:hypothetical protein
MDNLDKAKQEIVDLFGFNDDLAKANDAVVTLDAKQLIAYRITVDENATAKEWLEAMSNISKYERYIDIVNLLKSEGE